MAALLAISIAIGPTLAVSQSTARVPACKVTLSNAVSPNSCVAYDLCPAGPSAAAPAAGFQLNDSYPEPYLIAPPFREVDISNCSACPPGSVASGYQFAPGHFCSARCIALGKPAELVATAPLDHRHPSQGVSLTFGGGDGGRKMTYNVRCKPGAPWAPAAAQPLLLQYIVEFEGDAGCGKTLTSGCPAPPPLAKPTPAQLAWSDMEIGALIHFNMATTGSCSTDPSTFNPTKLDTDQWVEAFEAFGVREAVLVAKHGCGFVTWPTKARMPDGTTYNYSVASSSWEGGKGDVLASFKSSCLKKGIGVGYYYSLGSNGYTSRLKLSAAELEAIEIQQMTELWTTYGNNGNLTEIWFDGGIEGDARPKITAMLKKMQPHAVAFNGCVVKGGAAQNKSTCITPNALRWIGTEAGVAPDPNWSTGYNKGGDPNSDMFNPGESDTTLQNGDQWFYDAKGGIRSLAELQDVYHGTVGHNSFLMMDYAPTPEGLIAPDQVARYKQFGDWMRSCYYGSGVAGKTEHLLGSAEAGTTQLVQFDTPQTVDRVVIREDQTDGQAIRGWEIRGETSPNQWTVLANGSSVGNKWITLLNNNVTITALKSAVTVSAPGATGKIRSTSAHMCSRGNKGAACTLRQNYEGDGVGKPTTLHGKTVPECCAACTAQKGCAVFVFLPGNVPTCTLYPATGSNGKAVTGAVTGTPRR